jgi:hypothetical protein
MGVTPVRTKRFLQRQALTVWISAVLAVPMSEFDANLLDGRWKLDSVRTHPQIYKGFVENCQQLCEQFLQFEGIFMLEF